MIEFRNVDTIIGTFTKTITKLRKRAEFCEIKAQAAADVQSELATKRLALDAESSRARTIARKLEDVLG